MSPCLRVPLLAYTLITPHHPAAQELQHPAACPYEAADVSAATTSSSSSSGISSSISSSSSSSREEHERADPFSHWPASLASAAEGYHPLEFYPTSQLDLEWGSSKFESDRDNGMAKDHGKVRMGLRWLACAAAAATALHASCSGATYTSFLL